jgi:NAD(P)-dependent dehydrogenase (short-subunit alcohol dehydrogenase family)
MELTGKVAVVTGANSGIGRATCAAMAKRGIQNVAAVDRSEDILDTCRAANNDLGRDVLVPFVGDVTDAAFRRATFEELRRRFKVVNICVPAAGIVRDQLAVKVDRESGRAQLYPVEMFQQTLNLNVLAAAYWALETIATVAEDRFARKLGRWEPGERVQGCIVFIGSISSAGNRGQISYAASKAAMEGIANTLAKETMFYGVRCAIIHPGFTDTPMLNSMGRDYIENHILPNTQLRRLLRPEEIADGILFLIQNSAVSGSLWADAGWHPAA